MDSLLNSVKRKTSLNRSFVHVPYPMGNPTGKAAPSTMVVEEFVAICLEHSNCPIYGLTVQLHSVISDPVSVDVSSTLRP